MAQPDPHGQVPPPSGADPSMEDILASIRRILSEDEAASEPPAAAEPDVLTLDQSMLVEEPTLPPAALPAPEPPAPEPPAPERQPPDLRETHLSDSPPPHPPHSADPPAAGDHAGPTPPLAVLVDSLVTPEAAAAAAASVGSLVRTLGAHRQSLALSRGGPTLEDMVRESLRPILKAWLDEHLPGLVERLVRAEIERVVSRAADL